MMWGIFPTFKVVNEFPTVMSSKVRRGGITD